MSTSPSSSAKEAQKALGARLREIRKDAGLSGRALAAATCQHFTRVSKIEHGVQAPSDQDIGDWCRACGVEEQIPDLIATARAVESAYLEFRRQARAGMKRVLGAHTLPLYERTTLFRIYEHNVIPGLFQTAAYCTAMLSFWIGFLDAPDDLDTAVAARMERQRVIYSAGKRFEVVLEEQALRTWFGTAEIQAGATGPAAGDDVGTDGLARHHPDDGRTDRSRLSRILDLRRLPRRPGNAHREHRGHPAAGN